MSDADGIVLELGDVITLQYKEEPSNNQPYLIQYIDEDRIDLLNLETEDIIIIPIANKRIQEFEHEIEKITLLTRNPLKGYALQHGLTTGKYVQIGFVGITDTLVAEILECRNDIITLLVTDTLEILYIDFCYKGLPNEVAIKYIDSFRPTKKNAIKELSIDKIYEYLEKHPDFDEEGSVSINKLTEQVVLEVEGFTDNMKPWISRVIRTYVDKLNQADIEKEARAREKEEERDEKDAEKEGAEPPREFEEPAEEPIIGLTNKTKSSLQYDVNEADRVMKEESYYDHLSPQQELVKELFEDMEDPNQPDERFQKFYSLDEQVKDMLDDYLSRIPTEQRTPAVINKIHTLIQRYTQLRDIYIVRPPIQYPLYESIKHLTKSIGWLIPVVSQSLTSETLSWEEAVAAFLQGLIDAEEQYNSQVDNRYEDYLKKLDTVFASTLIKNPDGNAECVMEEPVATDLTVISNLEETPYLTKYLSTPQYSEALCLLSILTLPYAVARYSRVYTPLTTVYEATNMLEGTRGMAMFKIIRGSDSINNVYIGGTDEEPVSNEVPVDKTEINNYSLVGEKNIDTLLQGVLKKELDIEAYLKAIPYYLRGFGFSVYKISRQLEPFQIYYDRLKVDQKMVIEDVLQRRIKKYKRILKKNNSAFEALHRDIDKVSKTIPSPVHWQDILYDFDTSIQTIESVYSNSVVYYHFRNLTPNEYFLLTNKIDCGEYYNFMLSADKLSHELGLAEKGVNKKDEFPLIRFVRTQHDDADVMSSPVEASTMPFQYEEQMPNKVGKSEFALNAIQAAKNELAEKRRAQQQTPIVQIVPDITPAPVVPPPPAFPQMNPEVTQPVARGVVTMNDVTGEGLGGIGGPTEGAKAGQEPEPVLPPHYAKVTVLPVGKGGKEYCKNIEVVKIYIDIKDIHRDSGVDIESTNLPAPRPVVEGDYALLLDSSITVSYYIRANNKWRQDVNIQTSTIYDTPSMFCNMGLWCVRDFTSKKCVPMQDLATYMVQQVISQLPTDKVNEAFIEYIKENFVKQTERSIAVAKYNLENWGKSDRIKLNLGLKRDHVDIVSSPYLDIFLSIAADKNFGKRQQDTINFCMEYTRANNSNNNLETPYWRYCKETGVPLVPTSLFTIASLYNQYAKNMTKFQEELELVKKDVGMLSEDGAYVIDKYTGFKISEIVFDYSEEFDEAGFVIKTRDVIADVEKEEKELAEKKELMSTQDSKYVRYIIGFVSEKMSINLQKSVEFIVRNVVNTLIEKNPPAASKMKYLMFLTLGMIVIAIQTSIPGIVSRKTFPNCKEQFIGYPLTGNEEDLGALTYIACVISFAKQPSAPWNALSKLTVDGIRDAIKKMMVDNLLTKTEVQAKINEKTSYLLSSKVEHIIPEEHNIRKWTTYLPTLDTFLDQIKGDHIRNVTDDVLTLVQARPTTEGIDLLFSKVYHYSLGMQAKILHVVRKKANTALLKTALNIPFVENSCCIDHTPNSVLGYFEKEDPSIRRYIDIATELTNIIYRANRVYKSPQIVSTINTKRIYPAIGNGITSETIYAAFIHQIKQDIIDNLGKLPEDAEASLESDESSSSTSTNKNKKENVVKVFEGLQENIRRLKDAGISYTKEDFDRLLKHRFAKGVIPPEEIYKPHKKNLSAIEEELENMQVAMTENPGEGSILPLAFVRQFLAAFTNEKKGLSDLRTYLNNQNKAILPKVKMFLMRQKASASKFIDDALDGFVTPEIFLEMTQGFLNNMTQIFPATIINKTKQNAEKIDIPKYWDLSGQHETDLSRIMLDKYKRLEVLYEIPGVVDMVTFMKEHTKQFMSLVKKLSIYYQDYASYKLQNPEQTILDLDTIRLLFKYFVYNICFQYITISEDVGGGEGGVRSIPPAIVANMIDVFFGIFMNQKAVVNKEMQDVADSVINIKNIEKNRMLDELAKLTSDEHQSNKVLKALKLKRWSAPKNLRTYTKSGYDKDEGIFDEDNFWSPDAEEGGDAEDTGENDETFAYDLDEEPNAEEEVDFDFDIDWQELVGDEGDAGLEDGDYMNVDIEELNKE
jgi:hypothetical protein